LREGKGETKLPPCGLKRSSLEKGGEERGRERKEKTEVSYGFYSGKVGRGLQTKRQADC